LYPNLWLVLAQLYESRRLAQSASPPVAGNRGGAKQLGGNHSLDSHHFFAHGQPQAGIPTSNPLPASFTAEE